MSGRAARRRGLGPLGLIGLGAVGAAAAYAALGAAKRLAPPEALERTNFHGRTVSLAGGPALAAAATVTSAAGAGSGRLAAAALLAGGASGAVGLYDDIVGARPDQKASKGFRGHLSALREGNVTSGLVKIVGVGLAALGASALAEDSAPVARRGRRMPRPGSREPQPGREMSQPGRRVTRRRGQAAAPTAGPARGRAARAVNVLLGAGVIAGTANLVNLLDLRPGRAIKAGLLGAAPLLGGASRGLVAGPAAAAAALLPADLNEEIMLGDTGANAFGALLGLGVIVRTGPAGRAATLAALTALTLASERVSFTKVIEATPILRELDALGRRTDHADEQAIARRDDPPRSLG